MFAVANDSEIYHLIDSAANHTRCGQPVSQFTSPDFPSMLQLAIDPPKNSKLCARCEEQRTSHQVS
jgi:hypothetical protein